jgi:hypothetical protein
MRRPLSCLLIFVVLLVLSGISFAGEEIKTTQTKITTIHSAEKYIGITLGDRGVALYTDGDTKITKGEKEINFSDLSAGDKVEISYVKKGGFLGMGGTYAAKTIKVVE